ncbi:MAG: nicotinamide mononucleotide transporter [Clostridia bacterium]|nr:nicotinamide mononucleotide transporter [Clostridia bacterium]
MKRIKQLISYFTKFELALWCSSIALIIASYLIFDRNGYLTLIASLIGVTSLIYNAKGNPIGQVLIIIFSIFYGIISYSFAYYGEMLTYLCMSAPMALIALISWLKNPYKDNKAQVKVNRIRLKEIIIMLLLSVAVTVAFYFILDYFNTANIIPSTLSVTTSFIAAYLTFRRSPYYAFAYALNDIVLIVMWILASLKSIEYVSVIICFLVFLVNDLYGFVSWLKMERQQKMP